MGIQTTEAKPSLEAERAVGLSTWLPANFVVVNTLDSKGADTSTSTYYANRGALALVVPFLSKRKQQQWALAG